MVHMIISMLYTCNIIEILDHLMSYLNDMDKNVSQTLQWRMYNICMLKTLVKLIIMMRSLTADLTMLINCFLFITTVLKTTIDCTEQPRQVCIMTLDREIMQNNQNQYNNIIIASTDTQTVTDHDKCLNINLNTVTFAKNILWLFKNNFNHGFNAPSLTFLVLNVIFCSDLDSTSGTLKSKQIHVVTEHMTHHFWTLTNYQLFGVMLKNLYGHKAKELYFLNIAFGAFFDTVFHINTAAEKIVQISASKSDMMARFFRTLSRTARFTLKHTNSLNIKSKCIFMIKQTPDNTD